MHSKTEHKRILVSPLNWGLGHASRLIPIIQYLNDKKLQVYIASYGASATLLRQEFPNCQHLNFKGFTPYYSSKHSQTRTLIKQLPSFLYYKHKEKKQLQKIVTQHRIDLIISDNRYGLYCRNIKSILITHQLNPQLRAPFTLFQKPVAYILSRWIKRFNACWVPDNPLPNERFSGDLSRNRFKLPNVKYIGSLSRFQSGPQNLTAEFDYLIILSGPEPHRTLLEKTLLDIFSHKKASVVLVQGLTSNKQVKKSPRKGLTVYNYCLSGELETLIKASETIICRSGYSSIMDLLALGKKALLIPTPGQPEQEYLANSLLIKQHFKTALHPDPAIIDSLNKQSSAYKPAIRATNRFQKEIDQLLSSSKKMGHNT
jgi:uncharacterized protein (TIGR00661 family)